MFFFYFFFFALLQNNQIFVRTVNISDYLKSSTHLMFICVKTCCISVIIILERIVPKREKNQLNYPCTVGKSSTTCNDIIDPTGICTTCEIKIN